MNVLSAALLMAVALVGVRAEPNWSDLSTDVELLAEMISDRNARLTESMLINMLSSFHQVTLGGSDAMPPAKHEETGMTIYRQAIEYEAQLSEEDDAISIVIDESVEELKFENPVLEKLILEEKKKDAEDMERIVNRVETENKKQADHSTYSEGVKRLVEEIKLFGWPRFVGMVKDIDFVKLLDDYSNVDILHSNLVRALRESLIDQAGLDPVYWVMFDISLILVAFAVCMSLSLLVVLLLALASFMVWDGIFWLIASVAILKLVARCFTRSGGCSHEGAEKARSAWKTEGIVIFAIVLMMALLGVGLYATKIIDGNIVWGCVILTVVLIQIPIFPTVVKKSSSEGLWYGAFIVVLLTFGVVVMAQTDLITMYNRIRLRVRYPSADLDKYAEGYRAVDEARIAADLSQAAGAVNRFISNGIPMTWMDALSNPSTARETVSQARVYSTGNSFIWLTTEDHTTNVLMTFVAALAVMSMFMITSMGAKMAVEGEKREQNQAARGKDTLNKVDYTFTTFARLNSALTVTVVPLVMVVEYAGYQALFSKLHNMYGFIVVVGVCVLLATYWIERATAEAWMAMGAASHRSAKNTTAGVAHVSASSLKPLEDSVSGFIRAVLCCTTAIMSYLLWENGGWYMVYWTAALGIFAVLMVDVSQVRLHKQFWVLLPLMVLMQFYGTALMLVVWKRRGNITTFFTHRLHNVGAALQMVD